LGQGILWKFGGRPFRTWENVDKEGDISEEDVDEDEEKGSANH